MKLKTTIAEMNLTKKNWSKKKIIGIGLAVLVVASAFLFFNGKEEGYDYVEASEKPYMEKIVAVGQLGMENQIQLVSEVSGKIDYIGGKGGETISSGDLLLSIFNSDQESQVEQRRSSYMDLREQYSTLVEYDYAVANQELSSLNLALQQAKKDYEDAQTLYREGAISQNTLNDYQLAYQSAEAQATTARLKVQSLGQGGSKRDSLYYKMENSRSVFEGAVQDEAKYKLRADRDSVVLASYFSLGENVNPGDVLMDIGQAGAYKVTAELDEKYYLYLTKGMKVDIQLEGQPGDKSLEGVLSVINPKINKNTGTFEVEIQITSAVDYVASDLTVNLEILLKESEKAIVVPKQYLIEGEQFLYLYKNGNAVKTSVEVEQGPSANIRIIKGVQDGDIILFPQGDLEDGQKVTLKKGADSE